MTEKKGSNRKLTDKQREELLGTLKSRFQENMDRHKGIEWKEVLKGLEGKPEKLWSLYEMERTGGEPDVVVLDEQKKEIVFFDCSAESPKGRRSLCYDQQALDDRKENKPKGSALGMAEDMGIELLNEQQYRKLQEMGPFDAKTSSWIVSHADIRNLGGALFCDYRYKHVFTYHNGAISYYAARGFRGCLRM